MRLNGSPAFIKERLFSKRAEKLLDGTFMGAFAAKGRFQKLLRGIPVHVVMNNQVGLYGALAEAARAAVSFASASGRPREARFPY